jgi:peroxiredoxin Q/BCP
MSYSAEMMARTPSCTFAFTVALLSCLALPGCGEAQRPDGGKGPLPVGSVAPDVTGYDVHHHAVTLSASQGHPAVVYFYPSDGTPGCTKEACAFRDAWTRFVDAGVTVIGVSSNSAESHQQFLEEKKLPFALVSDPDHTISSRYGVGTNIVGDQRMTFLVDREGKIAKVWPDVDPGVHAQEVLAAVQAMP